jgi:hypothetical protein
MEYNKRVIDVTDEILPFDYKKIDTSRIEGLSDEQLLERVSHLPLIGSNCAGWASVAELAKRYDSLVNQGDKDA